MNEEKQIEEKAIEEMAKVIEITEQIARNAHCGLPSPRMYAKDLYWKGYRKQEWISVDDRLPEENGRYLACVNVSHLAFTSLTVIAVMDYGKEHGFYLYSEDEPVTHWMPLPEAPKMKGGAE